MQFVLIAHDGTDSQALSRRMAARSAHIALGDAAIKRGEQLMGAALLNKEGQMCGSIMIVEFENREKLNEWLKIEPYVTGNVWKDIEILPCKVGPSFVQKPK
jgi:uncharacterized protein YciI